MPSTLLYTANHEYYHTDESVPWLISGAGLLCSLQMRQTLTLFEEQKTDIDNDCDLPMGSRQAESNVPGWRSIRQPPAVLISFETFRLSSASGPTKKNQEDFQDSRRSSLRRSVSRSSTATIVVTTYDDNRTIQLHGLMRAVTSCRYLQSNTETVHIIIPGSQCSSSVLLPRSSMHTWPPPPSTVSC